MTADTMRCIRRLPGGFVVVALATACLAGPSRSAASHIDAALEQAIVAAGGREALANSPVLAWTGHATIHAGEQTIEIDVDTVVDPFVYARSKSWRSEKGPSDQRTLEVDTQNAYSEIAGKRSALATEMAQHEREQYAVYGLMRLVPLLDGDKTIDWIGKNSSGGTAIAVHHPRAQPATLYFDNTGRLVELTTEVDAPDGKSRVKERFVFTGTIEGAGIHWPHTIAIYQDDQLYFELTLKTFSPRASL
jgi:hypothetical protein